MNDEMNELIRTQRWMQAVITHPAGIQAGVASESARQNIDVTLGEVERIVSRSQALTGAERLMIYSQSFHARLLECFRAEFPCLLHALGDGLFSHFAIEYLQHYPPQSYTLRSLAENFPKFLEETRPGAGALPEEREVWPDFIIDLARLERAFIETYDGPGVEGQAIMNASQALSISSERLHQMRLVAVPCLRLSAFRYPVLTYFNAVREKKGPVWPAPSDTFLAINRINYVVRLVELSSAQYSLLKGLVAGLPISRALTLAADDDGHDPEMLALQLRTWLRDWFQGGFFIRSYES